MKKFISVLLLFTLIFSLASCNFKKSSSTELICSACGEENDQGSKFCFRCGNPFPANDGTGTGAPICSSCGTENESGSAFCANCGNALSSNSENANSGENVNGGGNENSGGNTVTDPSKDNKPKIVWVMVRKIQKNSILVYSYDEKGREIKNDLYYPKSSDTPSQSYVSEYNSDGLLASYTYYDSSSVRDDSSSYIYTYEFVNTPAGQKISKKTTTYANGELRGYEIYSYDSNGMLQEVVHKNAENNVKQKDIYENGVIQKECEADGTVSYEYFYENGRLVKEVCWACHGEALYEILYTYDSNGNIASSNWDGDVTTYEYMTLENYLANNPQ